MHIFIIYELKDKNLAVCKFAKCADSIQKQLSKNTINKSDHK